MGCQFITGNLLTIAALIIHLKLNTSKNGFNGLYYEPENAESLANAIIEVIKNKSFFSRGALQTFKEDMSLEAMINGFVSAISYACDK